MWFEEFQDCRHRYRNDTILAILNLRIALMSPFKFGLSIMSIFYAKCLPYFQDHLSKTKMARIRRRPGKGDVTVGTV